MSLLQPTALPGDITVRPADTRFIFICISKVVVT